MGNTQITTHEEDIQTAKLHAILDDTERSALLFLTSKTQQPESIPTIIQTLTNIGSKTGIQLSSCPLQVHLSTRNFSARLLRHQNPTTLRFLLDALIEQLQLISTTTTTKGNQRAILIQRTCNTLVIVRILLIELIAYDDQGILLNTMVPDKDREQLVLGLLRYSETYGEQLDKRSTMSNIPLKSLEEFLIASSNNTTSTASSTATEKSTATATI